MRIDDYQKQAFEKAFYPHLLSNIDYPMCGLIGETGELAEQIKKMIRDDGGKLTPERRKAIMKEAGDVLWYAAAIASEQRASLAEWLGFESFDAPSGSTFEGVTPVFCIRKIAYCVGAAAEGANYERSIPAAVWWLVALCHAFGFTLAEAAQANVDKLNKRLETGTLGGSGSDREERA
jgi:hypothetical protein